MSTSIYDLAERDEIKQVALALDDALMPTFALNRWRESDVFRRALGVAMAKIEELGVQKVVSELEAVSRYLTFKLRNKPEADETERLTYLAEAVVELLAGGARYRAEDEIAGTMSQRALQAVPGLEDKLVGKHRLFRLDDELTLHSHYATMHGYAIAPSMFLRRGFAGTPNFDLLRRIGAAAEQPQLEVAVALDTAHYAAEGDMLVLLEEDYWFGPPFAVQGIDDPHNVGTTRHGTPPPGEPLHYPVAMTEFRWQLDSPSLKSLHIEETYFPWDPESDVQDSRDWFVNRYVHSLRDISTGTFIHLDGAAKLFDKDGYEPYGRREKRSSLHYKKLFRLDGAIPDQEWVDLVAHFFRGNDHILEYFENRPPKPPPDGFPSQ